MAVSTQEELYRIIVETEGTAELQRLEKSVTSARKELKKFGTEGAGISNGIRKTGNAAKTSGLQFQNASYQIQDFFVQVAGGQGVMRALGQQVPQLASGFGVWGSAIGLAAAGASIFYELVIKAGDGATQFDKALDSATDSVSAFEKVAEESARSIADLSTEFGQFAARVKGLYEFSASIQNAAALTAANTALKASAKDLMDEYESLDSLDLPGPFQQSTAHLEDITRQNITALGNLTEALKVSEAEAAIFRDTLDALGEAKTLEESYDAAFSLAEQLESISDQVGSLPPEFKKFLLDLQAAIDASAGLVVNMDEATQSVQDMSDAMADAYASIIRIQQASASLELSNIGKEARLAALEAGKTADQAMLAADIAIKTEELNSALTSRDAAARAAANNELSEFIELKEHELALDEGAAAIIAARAQAERDANKTTKASASASKTKTEAERELEQAVKAVTKAYEDSLTSQEKSVREAAELARNLDLARDSFADFPEIVAAVERGIEDLQSPMSDLGQEITDVFGDQINNAFSSLIGQTASVEEAFQNMLVGITQDIAKFLVSQQIQRFIELLGSNIFGSGTNSTSDGYYTAQQNAVIPATQAFGASRALPRTSVIPSSNGSTTFSGGSSSSGGGFGNTNIVINNNSQAEVTAQTKDNSDGSKQVEIFVEQKVRSMFGSGTMDKTMQATYGLKRRPG